MRALPRCHTDGSPEPVASATTLASAQIERAIARSTSSRYRRALLDLRRFARTHETILLLGPTGTGKSSLARLVHEMSPRRQHPIRIVNMAAIDGALAISELFGHERGAFTGADRKRLGACASAHRGTLVLDEIGKSSIPVQQQLLDAIEHGQFFALGSDRATFVDIRIVAAANESLDDLVRRGLLLDEFRARLGVFCVTLPSLRERIDDLPHLLRGMIDALAPAYGYTDRSPEVSPELLRALMAYDWPRNLRELDGVVRRLLVDGEGRGVLERGLLVHEGTWFGGNQSDAGRTAGRLTMQDALSAIAREGGNKSRAAKALGVSRSTILRLLHSKQSLPS